MRGGWGRRVGGYGREEVGEEKWGEFDVREEGREDEMVGWVVKVG